MRKYSKQIQILLVRYYLENKHNFNFALVKSRESQKSIICIYI